MCQDPSNEKLKNRKFDKISNNINMLDFVSPGRCQIQSHSKAILIAFFLYEAFKRDVAGKVIDIGCYA